MFTCHCPNCGKELAVPRWLPRTVTCENCHTKSIVPYDQDPDFNEYNAIAKSKVKLNDFRTAHPWSLRELESQVSLPLPQEHFI